MGRPERLRIRRGRSGTEVDLFLDSVARVKKHPVRGPKPFTCAGVYVDELDRMQSDQFSWQSFSSRILHDKPILS